MPLRIWLASFPPPVASKASVADVALRASTSSVENDGDAELQTWAAPSDLSSSSCSGLRTILTSGIPSYWQSLTSIWPRLDAAAVCTRPECPSRRMVSVIPSAVIGLTNEDAPSLAVAPSGRTRHAEASTARYCEYMAPPAIATILPTRAWAAEDDPAATTVPAPSLPTGSDLSSRADSAPRVAFATGAVTTGRSGVPATFAVVMSALAMRRPKSDGLIGEASTRTNTSLAPGFGTGTSCSESSSVPPDVTNERNSRAVSGKSPAMGGASFLFPTDAQNIFLCAEAAGSWRWSGPLRGHC